MTDNKKLDFRNKLADTDWETNVYSIDDLNTAFDNFYKILNKAYDENFPATKLS